MLEYYEARAGEYDAWYRRIGRYRHGPSEDAAWTAELDEARVWLAGLALRGDVIDLAAGTGWWSPTLAATARLTLIDGTPAPLAIARERLSAAGFADVPTVIRDAWLPPDRRVDGLFTGFWLSHVPEARLGAFLGIARAWLRPHGRYAFIDSLPDPSSRAIDHPEPGDGIAIRRLDDGRSFSIVKVYRSPEALSVALRSAGLRDVEVHATGRFFVLGSGRQPG